MAIGRPYIDDEPAESSSDLSARRSVFFGMFALLNCGLGAGACLTWNRLDCLVACQILTVVLASIGVGNAQASSGGSAEARYLARGGYVLSLVAMALAVTGGLCGGCVASVWDFIDSPDLFNPIGGLD